LTGGLQKHLPPTNHAGAIQTDARRLVLSLYSLSFLFLFAATPHALPREERGKIKKKEKEPDGAGLL
jgi:hypothetical protein